MAQMRKGTDPSQRADIDDRSPASLDHRRGQGGGQYEGAPEIGLKTSRASSRSPTTQLNRCRLAPALLMRTSMWPASASTALARRSAWPRAPRSAGMTLADIGERAGIAKSVLYHHYGSKAGLYESLVEAETNRLLARVAATVPADPQAPRLRAGIEAYLDFLAERPAAWRLFLRDAPAEPELIEVYEAQAQRRAAGLTELLALPGKAEQSPC